MSKPYTDADVQLVARAIFMDDYPDSDPGPAMAQSQMPGLHEYVQNARAVLDALAAASRLAPVDDDPRHIIEFRPDGWTIKHPLACRPNLFACRVNRAAERDLANIDGPPYLGQYECSANDLGDRLHIGDRVDPPEVAR